MRRTPSLQRRLGIGLAFAITATWLVGTLAAGLIVRHELDETFDSALQETAQRLLPLAVMEIIDRDAGRPTAQRVAAVGPHEEYLTYLVRDPSGAVLLRSHDADPALFPTKPARGFQDTATHRLYGEAAVSDTIFIEIAEPLEHRRRAALEAAAGLFLPLPLLIPLSLIGVWRFVRRSMKPVLAFRGEIETRGGGNLAPVATGHLPAEVGPIAEAVNRLLERLRRVLEAERAFTANSAHELRTPIAAMLAQTQRLIAETQDGPSRERARQIEASLHRLAAVSEKLMQLARAEGGGLTAETAQDLGAVLVHVVDEFRRAPEADRRLKFTMPASGVLSSHIDADAFAILMRNLIENALRHGPPDEEITIDMTEDKAIRVVNGGATVPSEMMTRLKGRFERGATGATGSGLGLAIADAIAAGAGGRLKLLSPATGRADGFEAVLYLPESLLGHGKRGI